MATTYLVTGTGGGKEVLNTIASSAADPSIDLSDGNVVDLTLDDSPSLTFAGATAGVACSFTLILRQDGTGSRSVTWPASVDWPEGGTAPTLTAAASGVDVLTFLTIDGGSIWFGFVAGQAMA